MSLSNVPAGDKAPEEFNVVIEISAYAAPVKYEVDKASGLLSVDRFMNVSMSYPANYGYVPHTLYDDGDPVDVLVMTPFPVVNGCLIKCRAVAVLDTTDEKGGDAKILAVPTDKISTGYYADVKDLKDVPQRKLDEIEHFFTHYKDNEKGKFVKIAGWRDAAAAKAEIVKSIKAYK
ncbi:MAG: inorganic diphosphatase [Nevskiaceae bacterium]|nr:MAG: inorganic diphosphatase [Nevskiaceae bacterium]TBR72582.1 MAG: inorganic diphosphatase [Nevskiaceae bacterium]